VARRGGGGFRVPGNIQGLLSNLVSGGGQSGGVGGLLTKGSYHLKNRMLNGGLSGFGDVFHPGKDAFNVSNFIFKGGSFYIVQYT